MKYICVGVLDASALCLFMCTWIVSKMYTFVGLPIPVYTYIEGVCALVFYLAIKVTLDVGE